MRDYPVRLVLSAVVLMELYAGAHRRSDVKLINTLRKPFAKRRMIVVPTVQDYATTGQILARLQESKGYDLKKSYGLANDVLIALSACRIGATVVTQNRRDFEVIREIRTFSLQVV